MFIAYFFEGLIVGSLIGLLLRPLLDAYIAWRMVKDANQNEGAEIRVRIVHPRVVSESNSDGDGFDAEAAPLRHAELDD